MPRGRHPIHLLVLGAVASAGLAATLLHTPSAAALDRAEAASVPVVDHGQLPPVGVERVVAGDTVVDWIGGAPEGAAQTSGPSELPPGLSVPDPQDPVPGADAHTEVVADGGAEVHAAAGTDPHADVVEHHDEATGGYELFSRTARWLPSGYTIRLAGADRRIEQYRDELTAAARAVTAVTGVPVRVAGAFGGPVDPARAEIVAVLGSGPCGSGAVGCGGPGLTPTELSWGRVWVHPSALTLPAAHATNLAGHELGHALGLQHFEPAWSDGRQIMYPSLTGVTSYRAGDGAGLRRMAGADDQPAGTVTSRTYAAGRVFVSGTVSSGSRVRVSAGAVTSDVTASGGRFTGALALPAGTHVVCAASLDAAPGFRRDLGCRSVDAPGTPVAYRDDVRASTAAIRLSGWAIDPQTGGAVTVEVTRNGARVASVRADRQRGDLGALATHYGTAHGFLVDIPAPPRRAPGLRARARGRRRGSPGRRLRRRAGAGKRPGPERPGAVGPGRPARPV